MTGGGDRPEAAVPAATGWWTPRRYVLLLVGLALLHAALAGVLPLSGDEAYYWDCSRHPDWATFDQPPLMLMSMAPARLLLGESKLAVRLPAIGASFLLGLFLLGLIRRLGGGEREAAWAYTALHATPLFLLGAWYASTDVGMMTAWVAATWAAVALAQGDRRAWWGFGLAAGLGFLAKFPTVLVLPAILPALANRRVRRHLRGPVPYLAAAFSVALTFPVWLWGARHQWANVSFQVTERHEVGGLSLHWLAEFIGVSAVLASPPIFVAMVMACVWAARKRDLGWYAVLAAVASPFVFFGAISLREGVGDHWGAPGIVLAIVPLALMAARPRALIRWGAAFGVTLVAIAMAVVSLPHVILATDWPIVGRPRGYVADKLAMAGANEQILAAIRARLRPDELVASESYTNVHLMSFLSGGTLPMRLAPVAGGLHGLQFLYVYRPAELCGRNFLFFTERDSIGKVLPELFARVEELAPLVVTRDGRELRKVRFFRCEDLQVAHEKFTRLEDLPQIPGPR
jgi:hypothetical protein